MPQWVGNLPQLTWLTKAIFIAYPVVLLAAKIYAKVMIVRARNDPAWRKQMDEEIAQVEERRAQKLWARIAKEAKANRECRR